MKIGPRRLLTAAAVIAVLAGWWLLPELAARGRPPSQKAEVVVPVTIATVERRDLPLWWTGIGTVQPCNAVTLTPQVDGRLLRIVAAEGQDVVAGALLAQIDPRPFAAQVRQALANQARDQAQLDHARKDLAHNAEIFKQGIVTQLAIDALEASVATLTATIEADQAAVEQAQLQLEYTDLRAPFAGRTGFRLADPGAVVHPGGIGIISVTQISPISVVFTLTQDHIQEVLASQRGGARARVTVISQDGSRLLADGGLESLDSVVDSATGQVRLKATFPNTDRALWPGALVSARILLRVAVHVLLVPSVAIQRGQSTQFVFIVGADDRVAPRTVTVGEEEDGATVVRDGLTDGERVVVRGQYRLEAGTRVEPRALSAGPAPK